FFFFFSSRRRHTRFDCDWSSDVCSSDLLAGLIGWAGLALQLGIIIGNLGLALGLWRFVGFFTILANIGAAAVATAIALGHRRGRSEERRVGKECRCGWGGAGGEVRSGDI